MKKMIFGLVLFLFSGNVFAQSGWQWLNPVVTGNSLYSVSFFNDETGFCVGDIGTLVKTTNSGASWQTIRVPVSSKLNSIKFTDANTGIIAGDNSLILRTTNSGINWVTIQSSGTINLKSAVFQNANVGWAVGGNVILKTTDRGLSWINVISLAANYDLCKIDYYDINTIFVVGKKIGGGIPPSATSVILKSVNAGVNWTEINPGGSSITGIDIVNSGNIICVGNGGGPFIYKSTDFGNTWQNKLGIFYETMSDIAFFDNNTGVAIATGTNGRRFTTTNAGENWTTATTGGSFFNAVNVVSGTDAYMAGINGCLRKTTNAGVSWTSINQGYGIVGAFYSAQFFNENTGYVVGWGYDYPTHQNATILKTTNGGTNWNYQEDLTLSYGLKDIFFTSLNTGFAAGGYGVILKTTNGGAIWTHSQPSTSDFKRIMFTDSLNGIVIGGADVYRTNNGGTSWFNQYHNIDVNFISAHFINSLTGTVIGTSYGGIVIRTTNGGGSWVTQDLGLSSANYYNMTDVYFLNENTGFIIGQYLDYFKTTNGGANWVRTTLNFQTKQIKFVNSNTGYFAALGGLVYKTTNQGLSFTAISTGSSKDLYGLSFINENTGFVVGDYLTIMKTTTGGLVNITRIKNIQPDNFSLSQNYPNPFNPSTRINYELRNSNYVTLKVFDLLGKEVAHLVNEKQNAGSYAVDFNTTEFNLPSGIYFYTLNAGDYKETKKMVLIK